MSANDSLLTATAVDYDPFAEPALARVVPSTEPQREIWLAAKLDTAASLAYNEAIALALHGELQLDALQQALQGLVDRHEALRANLSEDGQELCIADHLALDIERLDLSGLTCAQAEADLTVLYRQAVDTPFSLERGPLVRVQLIRRDAQRHVLLFTAHHIICDGWSFGVIVRDLAALYAEQLGEAPAPLPAMRFSQFALEQAGQAASPAGREDEQYWLGRFASLPEPLDLPSERPRPRQRQFASQREDRLLDARLIEPLKQLGAQHGASLYACLLSGFALLLQRLTGQDDLVIGVPSAGQAAGGHDSLVGHAVNVLPLRVQLDSQQDYLTQLQRLRGDLLDAFEHRQYTLGSLLPRLSLPRDPSRLPLVSVLFNLDQALDERSVRFPGLRFEFAGLPRSHENFELFINAVQLPEGLRLECQYASALFSPITIRAWLDAYETLLRSALAEPQLAAGRLGLLSEPARMQLAALQPPASAYPAERLAHEFFEQQAAQTPQRIALRQGGQSLSYAALEARANRIAHALRARGVGRGSLVGLALGRHSDMLAALLGTLKAGAGYVPLDPAFPPERLAFMVEDAGLCALVVDDAAPDCMRGGHARLLSLALDAAELAAQPDTPLPRDVDAATPESLAYVIFTSGSTGRPKGVKVPHRTTANFLTAMQQITGIAAHDRLVAVTTLSFDIAFLELMLPLSVGAEVVLAGYEEVRDGAALRALVEGSGASLMQATPAGWRVLIEAGWQGHGDFRAITGGEPLPMDLAEALLARCGRLWNAYGPTETTVWSTFWTVDQPRHGIWIGRPIANTTVYVLDDYGAPCPLGVPGELWIGGAGVTDGYLDRPELTAERFVPDRFATAAGSLLYRTGDRGRWLASGLLEHLGRLDFQVKVRGYRIELGEIEAVLAQQPAVQQAVVVAREDRPGDVRLVGYLVLRDGQGLDEAGLRLAIKQQLPDYMLPQHLLALAAIPLLPNGKIDRKSLPAPNLQGSPSRERQRPRHPHEERVAAAMEAVLALPGLDIHEDFFALGGHSLLAAQLTARLNREFGVALSFRTLFDAPTIAGLAAAIDTQLAAGNAQPLAPIQCQADQRRGALSLMQQRLWALEELQPGRVTYHAPSAHRLRGPLNEAALQQAFDAMIARQPSLRTAFVRDGQGVYQQVQDTLSVPLFPAADLSTLAVAEREASLLQQLQTLTDTPFELTRAPLFRARLFKLAEDEHVLFFMPHHIIWDGWSFDLLYAELAELYAACSERREPVLPALPVSYIDFAAWHRQWLEGPQLQGQLAFWRERLGQLPAIEALPTDRPRRPGMSGRGRTEWIAVPQAQTEAMYQLARQADATLNMALLALYYVLLHGIAGQRELVVGTPVRGRAQSELESLMGYFNNLVPLHASVSPSQPLLDLIRQVRRTTIDCFGHPDVPLEYLQRELKIGNEGGGSVLYQALFSFQDARARVEHWGGLAHSQIPLFQSAATQDLGLWFLQGPNGMVGGVAYNTEIIDDATACQLRDRYLALIEAAVAQPQASIASLLQHSGGQLRQPVTPANPGTVTTSPRSAARSAPSTAAEQQLATWWCELLGVDQVTTGDNFFDLGGHSLLAVELASRVRRETEVQLNLLDIANGTLATVAAALAEGQAQLAARPASRGFSLRKWFGRR